METKARDLVGRLSAEVVVVILSVLVALQLEGRIQDRATFRLETAQLLAIEADLVENLARLDTVMVSQRRAIESGRQVLGIHTGAVPPPAADSLALLLGWSESWWRLEPLTGAYDAMVSSGDVTRLGNQELLRALASFFGDVKAGFEDEVASMDLLAELRRATMGHGLGVVNEVILDEVGTQFPASQAAVGAVVADPVYANLTANRIFLEINRLEYYERLQASIVTMLSLLDAELAFRGAA